MDTLEIPDCGPGAGAGRHVPWTHGLLTPYGSVELTGGSRTTCLGWRFELGRSLSLSLAGERREAGLGRHLRVDLSADWHGTRKSLHTDAERIVDEPMARFSQTLDKLFNTGT